MSGVSRTRLRASPTVAVIVAGLLVCLVGLAAGRAGAAGEHAAPSAGAVVSAAPGESGASPADVPPAAASPAAASPLSTELVEEGGGDQDGDAGRPKTTASGPGFLAVLALVLTVMGFRKFRRRRAARAAGDEAA